MAKGDSDLRVYKPHKVGLPNLRQYFSELWHRREFALELSRTNLRATNTNTVFGQLWLVFNPLLLAGVYFLLVVVLTGGKGGANFPHIAAGLFFFFYISGCMNACVTSVTNAGSLVLNLNFPKMLLIVSNVYLAFRRFLPTLLVYIVIHLAWRLPITLTLLWLIPATIFGTCVGMGLGALMATSHVYFRDTSQFLPYFTRIWLYSSPVLYTTAMFANGPIGKRVGNWILLNPAYAPLSIWHDGLGGLNPQPSSLIAGAAWSVLLLVFGTLFFISREREFAVRL